MMMFDWDDEEIANLLWGEGKEADDHIVPYPEDIEINNQSDYGDNAEKKLNDEDINIKGTGEIPTTSKLVSDGGVQEKNESIFASRTAMDSQLSSPSVGTSKIGKNLVGKETELDISDDIFRNQQEHKQLGELVDNSWANIASFDDLDRIFSNDELEGHTSLGNAEELWSPSIDLIREAGKSSSAVLGSRNWELGEELGNTSSQTGLNSGYMHRQFPPEETRENPDVFVDEQREYAESTSGLTERKVQDDWAENKINHQLKMDNINNSAFSGDVYSKWPSSAANISHYDRLCSPNFPSAVSGYQHVINACVPPYKNFPQSIHASSELSQGDVISFKKPVENTARPKKMTPQEKIEKLRRCQQMRALLAIQKQQQQLSSQTSCVEYPLNQKSGQEEKFLQMEKAELEADESLSNRPCCDPGSPNVNDNICTMSDMDEHSVEDAVLYQLQDIVKRLDTKVRLCIKDSLYRLAQSATQRHNANDMNAANRITTSDSEMAKEEISSHQRTSRNTMETNTNHVDRAVAHLLFHQPFKSSVKHDSTPESISTSKRVCPNQDVPGKSVGSSLSDVPKTQQQPGDSYLEDMQDNSHIQVSLNRQTENT